MPNKQLIQRLREAFNLPESMVSDEKVLAATKDTLIRAGVEFNMAAEVVVDDLITVMKKDFERIRAKIPVNFINGRID